MAGLVRVKVYDQQISALFDRYGEVGRFGSTLNREIFAAAVARAPARTGRLKASHKNNGVLKAGRYRTTGRISATADHASFVHGGTVGPILPKRGDRLSLPRGGGFGPRVVKSVAGQRANPWMEEAARAVLLRRGLI